jgi:predicted dehydrogenase
MSKRALEKSDRNAARNGSTQRIRVGIVGCGEVTQIMHWPSLNQLAHLYEVTALCDISERVLEALGAQWNVSALTTNHEELVKRSNVDVVLIANPNAFHAEAILAAINARKHVLVEKPMSVNRREAEQIAAAQKAAEVLVQVGYMRRYAPAFGDACAAVRRMRKIKFARVRDFIGSNSLIINRTSRVIRDENFSRRLLKETKQRDDELIEEAIGSDASEPLKTAYRLMLGLSSHDLSAMRELLGMPKKVLFAAQRANGRYLSAAFDYGSYVCQFETGIDSIPRFDAHLEVYGAEKIIRVQYDTPYVRNLPIRLFITESNDRGGVTQVVSHPAWGDPFVAEWEAFHENVTKKRLTKSGPTDFLQDLALFEEMAQLMRQS